MELLQPEMDEALDPSSVLTQPLAPAVRLPSYHLTRWEIVNRTLDIVDRVSGGRAGWVQRFFSFAFFGGLAAIVNLAVFYVMYYKVAMPAFDDKGHNVIAYVIAYEISVMANFIPNDYFTFSHLASQGGRSWGARCLRYQLTSLTGGLLTFAIEFSLSTFLHLTPIIGQAIATLLVLFYNFSFHHLFTYRHKSTPAGSNVA